MPHNCSGPERVSDDRMDGALGEGALCEFELEFDPKGIDHVPAHAELAFGFARPHAAPARRRRYGVC